VRLRGPSHQTAGGVWFVGDRREVDRLLSVLDGEKQPVGLDLEYTFVEGRHVLDHARITCLTLAYAWGGYLGLHPTGAWLHRRVFVPAFDDDSLIQQLKPWLESDKPKVGHNILSADAHVLRNHGIVLGGVVADTLRKSRMAYNSKAVKHGLKPCMERELGYVITDLAAIDTRPQRNKPKTYKTTAYRKAGKTSPLYGTGVKVLYGEGEVGVFSATERETIPHAELWRDYPQRRDAFVDYATLDAKGTAELDHVVSARLAKLPAAIGSNLDLYNRVWHPYCQLVAEMEVTGIPLDVAQCERGAAAAQADIAEYDTQLAQYGSVNWNAPEQLKRLLFTEWKLPRPPITGTVKAIKPSDPDEWSTAEASLHWLELNCEEQRTALGCIRRRRKSARLHGYLRDLPGFVHRDGRLHTVLAPSTDTGRLASSAPPLQQIPNSKSDKYGIRRAFVASPGHSLIVADYSQLEVYVLAHFLLKLFDDESVATAIATGDVYNAIAQICWPHLRGADSAKVKTPTGATYRDLAKIVVLARNYGKTEQGLAVSLLDETGASVGLDFSRGILTAYDTGFPGLARWTDYVARFARKHGGVATLLGRWRPIPECRSDKEWQRSAGNRKASNTPIQGSAADIVACAGLSLRGDLRLARLGYRQCLHVHDETIGEIPTEAADEARERVVALMENPTGISLRVPLKVEAKIAPSWAEGK
jgi:DNA polymerase I-like protein with 3'-5' exonuclease and polymerase domains